MASPTCDFALIYLSMVNRLHCAEIFCAWHQWNVLLKTTETLKLTFKCQYIILTTWDARLGSTFVSKVCTIVRGSETVMVKFWRK